MPNAETACEGTDPSEMFSERTTGQVMKELDKVIRSHRGIDYICDQVIEALESPAANVFGFLQERLSPDVILTEQILVDCQVFHAVRKKMELSGTAVDRSRGVSMAKKVFDALYSDLPDVLEEARKMLDNFKKYGTLRPNASTARDNFETQTGHANMTYLPNANATNHDSAVNVSGSHSRARPREVPEVPGNGELNINDPRSRAVNQNPYQSRLSLAKIRRSVASGFSQLGSKFSGSPGTGQPLHVVKRKFMELTIEQEIPADQQVQLIHNCLSGIANAFFYSSVRNSSPDISAAFSRLEARFDSKQHQAQALNYLKRLTFQGIKSEKGFSDVEVLNAAHARILKYIPQCRPSFQGLHQDGHMSTIMADIVDRKVLG